MEAPRDYWTNRLVAVLQTLEPDIPASVRRKLSEAVDLLMDGEVSESDGPGVYRIRRDWIEGNRCVSETVRVRASSRERALALADDGSDLEILDFEEDTPGEHLDPDIDEDDLPEEA